MLVGIYEGMGYYEEIGSSRAYLNNTLEPWDEETFEDFKYSQEPYDDMGF